MEKLILHPTEICQWYALVNEAQTATNLILEENTESYLVFLLMRFSQRANLLESILALDFLESMNSQGHHQVELLKEVGDKSLLFCGLFPGIAKRRRLNLNYFTEMGQAAYLTIGELQPNPADNIFYQLSAKFITLQHILQAMRGEYFHGTLLNSLGLNWPLTS